MQIVRWSHELDAKCRFETLIFEISGSHQYYRTRFFAEGYAQKTSVL